MVEMCLLLQCVFHGIRFKVNEIGCRETINFFCIYPNFLPVFGAAEVGVKSAEKAKFRCFFRSICLTLHTNNEAMG